MPRNGAGTYTLPAGNPVVTGTVIESSWANTTLADLAAEMTNSLARNGAGGMTGPFKLFDGVESAPGLGFTLEPSSGFYRIGSGNTAFSILGTKVLEMLSTGITIPKDLIVGEDLNVTSGAVIGGTLSLSDGAAATPSLTFVSNPDTGLYTNAAGALGIATAGVERVVVSDAGDVSFTGVVSVPNGSAAEPALTFANNPDTGLYTDGAALLLGTAGTTRITVANNGEVGIGMAPMTGVSLDVRGQVRVTRPGANPTIILDASADGGRSWSLLSVSANGYFALYDNGFGIERMIVHPDGGVSFGPSFVTVTGPGMVGVGVPSGNTSVFSVYQQGIAQWLMGMGGGSKKFYIGFGGATGFTQTLFVVSPDEYIIGCAVDNSYNCGGSVNRYVGVYATNGTIITSDATSKADIEDFDNGLETVLALRPKRYRMMEGDRTDKISYGLLAHEVGEVIPNFAGYYRGENGAKDGLAYHHFIAPLISAVQTLHERLAAVEAHH